jgi:outer membrane protein OmpA-like peptidoglycan-associated protein
MKYLIFALCVFAVGCGKKSTVKVDPIPEVAEVETATPKPKPKLPVNFHVPKPEKTITLYFDFDSDIVKDIEASKIHAIRKSGKEYVVKGAACPIGPEKYNYDLGLRRALAVCQKLRELGYEVTYVPMSVGEQELITTDPAKYGFNRRVEVKAK